jgi:hypothetical protein
MTTNNINLELYVVRNQDGKFFRAKGYQGSGNTWVDDIKNARLYAKIQPARTAVTFFTKNYPKFGRPEILKLEVASFSVIDEKDRVDKAIDKLKKEEQARNERNRLNNIHYAKEKLKSAQNEIKRLTKLVGSK